MVLDLDEKVSSVVKKLKERGLSEPVSAVIRNSQNQSSALDQRRTAFTRRSAEDNA
jgi:hypothetical protein